MSWIEVKHIALTALAISLSIPAFGLLMSIVVKSLYSVTAKLLGDKTAYFIFNYLTFLGVLHHEFSHALLLLITGAKVEKIVPFSPGDGYLGYVEYRTRGGRIASSIQNTFSAIAPVFCGAISSLALLYLLLKNSYVWWLEALLIYVLASVVLHMTMSREDAKNMLRGYPVVYMLIFLIILLYAKIGLLL